VSKKLGGGRALCNEKGRGGTEPQKGKGGKREPKNRKKLLLMVAERVPLGGGKNPVEKRKGKEHVVE